MIHLPNKSAPHDEIKKKGKNICITVSEESLKT
jgi:hypothetical protein